VSTTAPGTTLWAKNTTPEPKRGYYDEPSWKHESKTREENIWVEGQLTWNRNGVQLA